MDNLNSEKLRLLEAYRLSISPEASNAERGAAFSLFETYKDNADKCLTLGSLLIASDGLDEKLLGFELLQNFIRKGWALKDWNMDSLKEKFKCEIILYLQGSLSFSSSEELQMKNSISKLLIALIIQEFPQKWPGLLSELYNLVKISHFHNTLVLAVFQRVAEEIINMPHSSLPAHRTKDIRQFLIQDSNLQPLMALICENICSVVDENKAEFTEGSVKLAANSLYCLNQYLEWMPFEMLERCNVREYLVLFLNSDHFLVAAVDCLIAMLKRRNGSVKERAFLLSIFKLPSLQKLHEVIVGKSSPLIDEPQYLITKKLLELIGIMNDFYLSILSRFENELRSISKEEYHLFLQCLFSFRLVQSHVLTWGLLTAVHLNLYSKNSYYKFNLEVWNLFIPIIYECSLFILTKSGFPSMTDHQSSKFARIDFGDDLECGSFIAQGRSLGCDVIKDLVDLDLEPFSQLVLQDISTHLQEWRNLSMAAGVANGKDLLLESKLLAFTTFVSKIDLSQNSASNPETTEIYLKLREIFSFSLQMSEIEQNVIVLNSLLTVLSSLFVFWFETQENFVRVIKLIFKCFYFESNQAAKKSHLIHRHASSLLLGKTVDHLHLFLPFYNDFFPILSNCFFDINVDRSCRSSVLECLVALTTFVNDPIRTENLLHLMRTPVAIFDTLSSNLTDIGNFLSFMGLNTNEELLPNWNEMQDLRFSITATNGFLRRFFNASQKQATAAEQNEENSSGVLQSLGTVLVERCWDLVATVLQRFHELHDSSVRSRFSSQFADALEVTEVEKRNLLGIQLALAEVNELVDKTPVYRVQGFVKEVHTNAIQAICSCVLLSCSRLEVDVNLAQTFLNVIFHNFQNLSNYFIGNIINFFLVPLKDKCPERYHRSVLLPILKQSLAIIFPRMCQDWEKFCKMTVKEADEDAMRKLKGESDMGEEVLEDLFLRRNTRSVISIITTLMMAHPGTQEVAQSKTSDSNSSLDVTDKMISSNSAASVLKPKNQLKKFAMLVFQDDVLYENLLLILINAFVWPDSTASTKSAMIFWPLFQPIIERGPSNEVVALVLTQLLKGYQVNEYCSGTSPLLLSLLFKFYLSLRPRYPIIKDIFNQIPEIVPANFEKFEKEVFANYVEGQEFAGEKKWKDWLRNILKGVVGRPISSMYRDSIIVSKLPQVPPKMKMEYDEKSFLDNASGDNGADNQLLLLFS